ncbi:MAG: DUF2089 family protein [Phycisphaerae bacterium]
MFHNYEVNFNESKHPTDHPLLALPPADLDLVAELVLHGGSLKELAAVYDVSYPTIRTRLDRVIARLRELMSGKRLDPFNEMLAQLVERGELTAGAARALLDAHRAASVATTGEGGPS